MQAKVVETAGAYRLVLPHGESISLDPNAVPESLSRGGSCRVSLVPTGEAVPSAQARDLLNQLLGAA